MSHDFILAFDLYCHFYYQFRFVTRYEIDGRIIYDALAIEMYSLKEFFFEKTDVSFNGFRLNLNYPIDQNPHPFYAELVIITIEILIFFAPTELAVIPSTVLLH